MPNDLRIGTKQNNVLPTLQFFPVAGGNYLIIFPFVVTFHRYLPKLAPSSAQAKAYAKLMFAFCKPQKPKHRVLNTCSIIIEKRRLANCFWLIGRFEIVLCRFFVVVLRKNAKMLAATLFFQLRPPCKIAIANDNRVSMAVPPPFKTQSSALLRQRTCCASRCPKRFFRKRLCRKRFYLLRCN